MVRQQIMDRQDWKSVWELILAISPAPIGALIGLRYAAALTRKQQTTNFLCSLMVGYFGGAVVGEVWELSSNATALTTIVTTAASMEIMAGVLGIARAFAADPFGVFGKMLDLVGRVFRRGAS